MPLKNKPSVTFFLEQYRPNADGLCPIKISIYYASRKKRYVTNRYVTLEEWEKMNKTNLRDRRLKKIKDEIIELEKKANRVIKNMEHFSFAAFEEAFFKVEVKAAANLDLRSAFNKYINELEKNGRIGNAATYKTALSSIEKYKKGLSLLDITPRFLRGYEAFMREQDRSVSTIGIYLRHLRAIINRVINEDIYPPEKYPFKKYQIPSSRNVKKALNKDEIRKIMDYKSEDNRVQEAVDFWVFSYLCNGMNMIDIINLKRKDVEKDYFSFVREKTKRTKKKDLTPIKVPLLPRAKAIMEKYKNPDKKSPFVFSVLEPGLSPVTARHRSKNFVRRVNQGLEVMREELEISMEVKTYSARHSFSTILKRQGAPTSLIKEALGHSSEITTENYLDSFTDDVKMEYAKLLTDF